MTPDEARAFLHGHHQAVLSTVRADGRPQLSPVLAAVDAEGRVIVSTREKAMKTRNLRRDPRVSMLILGDQFFGDWVQVEGQAEVVSQPEALELLDDYYRRTAGEHDDWDDYRAAMIREGRVLVRFEIERAGPNVAG
jgi:PPOX class probable F420-dependent enzyme